MRRNPTMAMPKFAREWFGGVDLMDMGAALGGLAAATMLPGMIIKTAPTTMGTKLIKISVSMGSALVAGFAFRNISANAGKYAIAGGMAGALAQALGMFTDIKIGRPAISNFRQIGESRMSPVNDDAGIQVSVT